MQINLTNRIPKDLELEVFSENDAIANALLEEGVDELVHSLYRAVRDTLGQDEMMWEGYWVDQKNSTTNLYIVGVLKHNNLYLTRVMRVKTVPALQRKQTEQALTEMIAEYLDGLLVELERIVPPGKGKGSLNGH